MSFRYLLLRVLGAVPLLFGVSLILFAVLHLAPGSPLDIYTENPAVTPEALERIRVALGLDQPLHVQYLRTMEQVFTGSVVSYAGNLNVVDQIRAGLPATLSLALGTAVLWMVASVLLGAYCARRAGGSVDRLLGVLAVVGVSVPVYVVAAGALYGGSVTSANIAEFLAEPAIDGALVGGASLKPDEMAGIVARAGLTAAARSTAAWASTPKASTARRFGRLVSSARRNWLQVRTSAGCGRFAGGTQRTAFTTRQCRSSKPSSTRASYAPVASPNFSSV